MCPGPLAQKTGRIYRFSLSILPCVQCTALSWYVSCISGIYSASGSSSNSSWSCRTPELVRSVRCGERKNWSSKDSSSRSYLRKRNLIDRWCSVSPLFFAGFWPFHHPLATFSRRFWRRLNWAVHDAMIHGNAEPEGFWVWGWRSLIDWR